MAVIFGIDPGGAATGLVLRDRDKVLDHAVVERARRHELPYLEDVAEAVTRFAKRADHIAVEGLTPPSPYINGKKQLIRPEHVMNVSVTYGWVLAVLAVHLDRTFVIVQPNGHGSRHEALGLDVRRLYPAELIGHREGPAGTGILRHARSAWDIAGAAKAIRPGHA